MYVTVNGVRLAYSDRGRSHAQVLLLVHGFPLDRHLWDSQLARLSETVRVVAPDLRGAGDSDVPAGPYSMDQHADDLAALLDHLGIRCAVIGGLSMGGYVAFAFWRRYPERVRSLALLNTRAEPDSPEARANREATIARVLAAGVQAFAREQTRLLLAAGSLQNARIAARTLAMMDGRPGPGLVATLQGLRDRPDSRPTLSTITVPTLVLAGDEDRVAPLSVAQGMAAAIPGARLVVIRRAAHLTPLEQPRAVNLALRAFLA